MIKYSMLIYGSRFKNHFEFKMIDKDTTLTFDLLLFIKATAFQDCIFVIIEKVTINELVHITQYLVGSPKRK